MSKFKQDMPPPGGYGPIHIQRVPAKSFFNGYTLFAGYLGVTAAAFYLYFLNLRAVRHREMEVKGATLALYPMLTAEQDRAYLKQLRINREEERELMKNVPGWKVGTWYGEPIYKSTDSDFFIRPRVAEYFVHSEYKDMAKRTEMRFWS